MEALQNFLQKWLMPIAAKIEKQQHLQAIKDGMIGATPFILVGSMCLLPMAFMNLIGSGPVYDFLGVVNPFFTTIAAKTTDFVAIYACYLIARSLAKRYDIDNTMLAISSVAVLFILTGVDVKDGIATTYFGSSGLFTSMIAAILTVEIARVLVKYNVVIKLPDSVPDMVSESFSALIPIFFACAAASGIALASTNLGGAAFPALIMNLLAPAISSMDTLPALLIVIFLTQLLWFFGLHGPSITQVAWAPFAIAYATENAANYAAGQAVTHVFTYGFYFNVLQVTGSGLTLGLVIFMLLSKSQTYKAIGKAAIVPSIFGINEPVIFGAPILLNPFMFIPFVFGPLVCTVISWFAFATGLVGMPITAPPGFMPPGVGAYLMTLDWRAPVLVVVLLVIMAAIYYPFFKLMEKEQLETEAADEATAASK